MPPVKLKRSRAPGPDGSGGGAMSLISPVLRFQRCRAPFWAVV